MEHHSIVLISCYFGKLPWYTAYFLKSCLYNRDIQFLIFTDDLNFRELAPENVQFVFMTLKEFNTLATQKLSFPTQIDHPYKVCDFKPTYGLLFQGEIQEYDFWGHIDLDLIFGNIRFYISNDILNKYDLIAVRDDFLTGYFLLYRNTEQLRTLFMHSKDYKKVLSESTHYCFDETNFCFEEFRRYIHYSKVKSEIESMTHVVMRLHEAEYIKAYFDFHIIEGAYGKLKWNKGKLTYKNKFEVLLYHMILFKSIYTPENNNKTPVKDSFRISKTRIY